MHLTIFGATGPTGRLVIERALAQGHHVTAYARTPAKLDNIQQRTRLTVLAGELHHAEAIRTAVTDADAVISLLGPGRDKASIELLAPGMKTIVEQMTRTGVRRLVATSTASAPDPTDGRDLRLQAMVTLVRLGMPPAYRSITAMAETIRTSSLDWTLVRLPLLHDKPTATAARARSIGEPGGLRLFRPALADFLLGEASDGQWNGRAPLLADH